MRHDNDIVGRRSWLERATVLIGGTLDMADVIKIVKWKFDRDFFAARYSSVRHGVPRPESELPGGGASKLSRRG